MGKTINRRTFVKTTAIGGLGAVSAMAFTNAVRAAKKPNIIWIMPDDLGYGDLGCYGCKDIPTPHIDGIARNGVKFESFYAAAPTCTPSRASILSGRYPEAIGMTKVLMGKGGMSSKVVTIAEVLRRSGYATGLVGKWHLGYAGASLPNSQGFDEFYGHRGGKIDYFKHTDSAQKVPSDPMGKHDFYDNNREIFPKGYSTDLFTRRALKFVTDHKKHPFFLFLAYNAPHYARRNVLQAPDKYVRRFASGRKPSNRQLYAAMVSCMDDGIGELLACLKKSGLDRDTIVMFISDNGADPKHGGSNNPLSGGKWKRSEGGIRVPMIAQWPGKLPGGATVRDAVHMIDLFPTMLAVAGVGPPRGLKLDGLNVLDVMKRRATLPQRPLFFGKDVVRKGKWKLMGSKLYDLNADPREKRDLAKKHPEVVGELRRLLK